MQPHVILAMLPLPFSNYCLDFGYTPKVNLIENSHFTILWRPVNPELKQVILIGKMFIYENMLSMEDLLIDQRFYTWIFSMWPLCIIMHSMLCCYLYSIQMTKWRHNGGVGVLNHRCLDGLLKRLFRRRSKKRSKLRITGLCEGTLPMTSGFPSHKGPVTLKTFPFDDVIV